MNQECAVWVTHDFCSNRCSTNIDETTVIFRVNTVFPATKWLCEKVLPYFFFIYSWNFGKFADLSFLHLLQVLM